MNFSLEVEGFYELQIDTVNEIERTLDDFRDKGATKDCRGSQVLYRIHHRQVGTGD